MTTTTSGATVATVSATIIPKGAGSGEVRRSPSPELTRGSGRSGLGPSGTRVGNSGGVGNGDTVG